MKCNFERTVTRCKSNSMMFAVYVIERHMHNEVQYVGLFCKYVKSDYAMQKPSIYVSLNLFLYLYSNIFCKRRKPKEAVKYQQ